MTRAVRDAAFAALDRRLHRTSTDRLAVAVSGGGDSMALLRIAAAWARGCGRELRVLTIDHGLNAESEAWTAFVAATAARLGLATQVLRWRGPKPVTGLPAAARAARHALLAEACREAGARVLLLGHTADDLAEAAAMRAAGSTVGDPTEWSPSPAWPEGRDVFLLRPLLSVRRQALRAWLLERGERWIEDPANADPRFARSQARHPSPLAGEGGSRSDPDEGCKRDVNQVFTALSGPSVDRRADTPHPAARRPPSAAGGEGVLALTRTEAARWLSQALVCASGGTRPPRREAVDRLTERVGASEDLTATLAGARLQAAGHEVLIGREPGRGGLPSRPIRVGETVVWDGRFEITADAAGILRPLNGLITRLDPADRRELKAAPAWVRPTLPVLETPGGALRTPLKRPLAHDRLLAACGAFAREADLPPLRRGARPADGLSLAPTFSKSVAE